MESNTQLIQSLRPREFKWHLPVPTRSLWQSQDMAPFTKLSPMLFPLCSLSGVARLTQVLLPKDGKDGRKWMGRGDGGVLYKWASPGQQKCEGEWATPGEQVETGFRPRGGFRQRKSEEKGGEIGWDLIGGEVDCLLGEMLFAGSRSPAPWGGGGGKWRIKALGGRVVESAYVQCCSQNTLHKLCNL